MRLSTKRKVLVGTLTSATGLAYLAGYNRGHVRGYDRAKELWVTAYEQRREIEAWTPNTPGVPDERRCPKHFLVRDELGRCSACVVMASR